jgi:peroxiredoxin
MAAKRWNWQLWAGFALSIAALAGYILWVNETRAVFWPALLLFVVAAALLVSGSKHRSSEPELYRGKIAGPVLTTLSVLIFAFFGFVAYQVSRVFPAAKGAPQIGQRAPEFSLVDANGKSFTLAELLSAPVVNSGGTSGATKGVLVVFYRGYWWASCTSELRGIQRNLGSLEAAGVKPVAISADTNDESLRLLRVDKITFPLLSDRKGEVIRTYDLLVPNGGQDNRDVSGIAEFLLDSSGKVRWRHFGETNADRLVNEAKKL